MKCRQDALRSLQSAIPNGLRFREVQSDIYLHYENLTSEDADGAPPRTPHWEDKGDRKGRRGKLQVQQRKPGRRG